MESYDYYKSKFYLPAQVKKEYSYFAYKSGNVSTFATLQEANNFSSNVEKFCSNLDEFNQYNEELKEWSSIVFNSWITDLRFEHKELTQEQFDLCYDMAYNESHSDGYDQVANTLDNYVEFCNNIIKTVK